MNVLKNRYAITQTLGQSEVQRIFLAEDMEKQRQKVVVKQILNPELSQRLQRKYHFLLTLDHPNIAKVSDFFLINKQIFLVQEFIVGVSLKEFLKYDIKIFSIEDKLAVANQLAKAIETINTAKVFHTALAPSSFMLETNSKQIKLLDLGVVKSLQNKPDSQVYRLSYLSPEQIHGGLAPGSNIFSLGVILFQIFAEKNPFFIQDAVVTKDAICTNELPPLENFDFIDKRVCQQLSLIIAAATAKDPLKRPQQLAHQLEQVYLQTTSQKEPEVRLGQDFPLPKEIAEKAPELNQNFQTEEKKQVPAITIVTFLQFLIGKKSAIKNICYNKSMMWMGFLLAFTQALAHYHTSLYLALEFPAFLYGAIVPCFSFLFLFVFIMRFAGKKRFVSCLTLYLCTSPILWLYAIPLENFFSVSEAARISIFLGGIAEIWWALLVTQILSVVLKIPFLQMLFLLLLPFSFFAFGRAMYTFASYEGIGMGAVVFWPEHKLFLKVAGSCIMWIFAIGLASFVLHVSVALTAKVYSWKPLKYPSLFPWPLFAVIVVIWIGLLSLSQPEAKKRYIFRQAMAAGKHDQALKAMSQMSRDSIYFRNVFNPLRGKGKHIVNDFPKLFALLDGKEPLWVRELMLQCLNMYIRMRGDGMGNMTKPMQNFLTTLQKVPEGASWVAQNMKKIEMTLYKPEQKSILQQYKDLANKAK